MRRLRPQVSYGDASLASAAPKRRAAIEERIAGMQESVEDNVARLCVAALAQMLPSNKPGVFPF